MKFVTPLNEATRKQLWAIAESDPSARRRRRAHAVLLSAKGYRLDAIADIFERDRDSVSAWLTRWEERAFDGLSDDRHPGRPPKTSATDERIVRRAVERHPHNLKEAQAAMKKKGIVLGAQSIRRRLRKAGYAFKRIVKRPAKRPDPKEYERAKRRLQKLERLEERGVLDVVYADATGFSRQAPQPSAWQHPDRPLWIAAGGEPKRLNVFGFLSKSNAFDCLVFEKTLDDRCVIAAIDMVVKRRTPGAKPLHIVLDNAPIHHTDDMQDAQERWKRNNVFLEFLPTYSPELNRIEILWRRLKYLWLPLEAWYNFANLKRYLFDVLKGIGSKYRINFAH